MGQSREQSALYLPVHSTSQLASLARVSHRTLTFWRLILQFNMATTISASMAAGLPRFCGSRCTRCAALTVLGSLQRRCCCLLLLLILLVDNKFIRFHKLTLLQITEVLPLAAPCCHVSSMNAGICGVTEITKSSVPRRSGDGGGDFARPAPNDVDGACDNQSVDEAARNNSSHQLQSW